MVCIGYVSFGEQLATYSESIWPPQKTRRTHKKPFRDHVKMQGDGQSHGLGIDKLYCKLVLVGVVGWTAYRGLLFVFSRLILQ